MIEFSEDFNTIYRGVPAARQRVLYRIMFEPGDIPYFAGGVTKNSFGNLAFDPDEVAARLSDINPNVELKEGSIVVGEIEVPLEGVV